MAQVDSLALLLRARYAGMDFSTHLDDLKSRLQIKFATDYNDFAVSSMGIMLLDVFSYGLETLSFYLDRRASDTYISTARTRRSVARLARQLGYKMGPAISSSTDLTVSVKNPQSFQIPVPKKFQFRTANSIVFEVAEEVVFPAGSTDSKLIPVYQGQSYSESFVSDGTANQVFELARVQSGNFVAGRTMRVVVDGVAYEERDLLEFEETEQFEVGYNDNPPTLRFGNGAVGKIPPTSATIAIEYVITQGKAGQVNRETINAVVQQLVVAFTKINLNVTNLTSAVGGDDWEDLEHAKSFAPRVWKTRQVAVTREDYESLAGAFADPLFGRVAVAQALSPRSADQDLELQNDLQGIRGLSADHVPIVQADVVAIEAELATLGADLVTEETLLTSIAGSTSAAHASDAGTAINALRSIKNTTQEVDADNSTLSVAAAAATALVAGITIDVASTLTASDHSDLLAYLGTVSAESSSITSHTGSIASQASSGVTIIGQLKGRLEDIGLDLTTSGSNLYDLEQLRVADAAIVGEKTGPTGLFITTTHLSAAVVDNSGAIGDELQALYDHVDRLLSADCKANLVTVPILARDVDGFYAPPSIGLIKVLQAYLEQRNEVTQTVEVVSGELYLVPGVLVVQVAVYPGYVQSVTEAAVRSAIDGLLKNRSFGQSLYRSILTQTILKVAGVGWCNVEIDGYYRMPRTTPPVLQTDKIDTEGNLILTVGEVLTRGLVTVTSTQLTYLDAGNLIPKLS